MIIIQASFTIPLIPVHTTTGVRVNWSPRFNVNQGGAVSDSTYYTILSFMIPKLVTQTTSYVDDSGKQIAQSYVQQGLSGQTYTTTGIMAIRLSLPKLALTGR